MANLFEMLTAFFGQFVDVLQFPFDPRHRVFWLYIATSIIAAWFVYRAIKRRGSHATDLDADAASGSFLQFLFPKRVWSHPSAWLDLRYALFHKTVSNALMISVTAVAVVIGYHTASGGAPFSEILHGSQPASLGGWGIAVVFMIVNMLILDLIAWTLHYLQHRVPLLWQFHKVHHSAEVMHPISNYREHPIDNLTYSFFTGLGYGMIYALAVRVFGMVPSAPSLFGVPILMFLFNVTAYNLRHSHVWLRWPGRWSAIFPSPAHHHVHHSCHPDHIDKNFAFMFPLWDVVFGTYTMPDDNRDVKFGVPEHDGRDLDSVWRLYWVPFRDAYRLFARKKRQDEAVETAQTPAE
ncbi:MAG: sterol desaturase family protein [Pseudomonadota bacterium]